MHEVFLQRLAAHPVLRTDMNFEVFLEFDQDVSLDYDYMINIDITCSKLYQTLKTHQLMNQWYVDGISVL